jgi:hypothetical protein
MDEGESEGDGDGEGEDKTTDVVDEFEEEDNTKLNATVSEVDLT